MNLTFNNRKHVLTQDSCVSTEDSNIIIRSRAGLPVEETMVIDVKNPAAAILLTQLLAESIESGEDASISVSKCRGAHSWKR